MSVSKYDSEIYPDNKYGHALELLRRNLANTVESGVVLDLACGLARIAEPIREEFGLEYVGVDVDDCELESVRARGIEAHTVDLASPDVGEALIKVLDGRPLAGIVCLDGIEHLTDPRPMLEAMSDLMARHRAVAVTSVPNATHIDIGIKALMGMWHYTDVGLLDRTHYQLYSKSSLEGLMRSTGLRRIDEHDVLVGRSDQHFPTDHVGLSERTSLSQWLRGVRHSAEPNMLVNQFVWALTSAPAAPVSAVDPSRSDLFLSVIMRTQGRRPQEFREALLTLAAQSCTDFELLVVAHRTDISEQKLIERIIADQPATFRERIRLLLLDRGRRSTPLNLGLAEARGRYVAVFDDDDIVLGDWVEEFRKAEVDFHGRVLRTVTLRQDVRLARIGEIDGVRATGSPEACYAQRFLLTQHLVENQSPPIGWVFPRSLHVDFGLTYDDSMTTTEDWDLLLRAAELAGVTDIEKVTAIYRWWEARESSRTVHPMEEWVQNQGEIERRIDARPLLLPAGESRALRKKLKRMAELEAQTRYMSERIKHLEGRVGRMQGRLANVRARNDKLRERVASLQEAASTASHGPVRRLVRPRTRVRAALQRLRED